MNDKEMFKIFYVEKSNDNKETKHEVHRFKSDNYDTAYAYLKKYVKMNKPDKKLYFEKVGCITMADGTTYESFNDVFNYKASFVSRVIDDITWYAWHKWVCMFKDIRYNVKRLLYLVKNKHFMNEHWSLDHHMLSDLKFNLKKLIEIHAGIPMMFIEQARKECNIDDLDLNEIDDYALKIRNETYSKIVDCINLYWFYNRELDENSNEYKEIVKTHKLPLIPGTYDSINYEMATKCAQRQWNKIWDMMKKYGQTMWD